MNTFWKTKFENPVVLSAAVASVTTLCIALVTACSGLLTASIQSRAETERAIRAERTALATSILDQIPRDSRLKAFIDLGMLPDDDCKMRQVLLSYTKECEPPKRN